MCTTGHPISKGYYRSRGDSEKGSGNDQGPGKIHEEKLTRLGLFILGHVYRGSLRKVKANQLQV